MKRFVATFLYKIRVTMWGLPDKQKMIAMKKFKIVMLVGCVGLLAVSCGESTTDETMTADSVTTVSPADNTAGRISGGTIADTAAMSIPDTTIGDTIR
jgi:hypothetical protein